MIRPMIRGVTRIPGAAGDVSVPSARRLESSDCRKPSAASCPGEHSGLLCVSLRRRNHDGGGSLQLTRSHRGKNVLSRPQAEVARKRSSSTRGVRACWVAGGHPCARTGSGRTPVGSPPNRSGRSHRPAASSVCSVGPQAPRRRRRNWSPAAWSFTLHGGVGASRLNQDLAGLLNSSESLRGLRRSRRSEQLPQRGGVRLSWGR